MPESTRKLAAIVFTDIVGFTKLTADDQQKASDLLDLQRSELKPLVESHGGKWVKEVGDGLILTFDTITNAVQCCLKIQDKARSIENLSLRIGVHLGEILVKEGDIIGDDVNITARIEPFSAPGGIAISNKVNDALVREANFTTKYLGKPQLKGVGQEVKVYCITSHGLPETDLSKVTAKLEGSGFNKIGLGLAAAAVGAILIFIAFIKPGEEQVDVIKNSFAIFNFENLAEENSSRLGQIVQELLIADLSGIKDFKVFSSQRLFAIQKQMGIDSREIDQSIALDVARKAGAEHMLTGNIISLDNKQQVTGNVLAVVDGTISHSRQVNGMDIYSMVDELTKLIQEDLKIQAAGEVLDIDVREKTTGNMSAYNYYLEGIDYLYQTLYDESIDAFKQAISLDPKFKQAYFKLADTQLWAYYFNDSHETLEKLSELLNITPDEQEIIRGTELIIREDYLDAESIFEIFTQKEPDNKEHWYYYAETIYHGRANMLEALDAFESAVYLDPGFATAYVHIFDIYLNRELFKRGLRKVEKYLELFPENAIGYLYRGQYHLALGDKIKAESDIDKALSIEPENPMVIAPLLYLGKIDRAEMLAESQIDKKESEGTQFAGKINLGNIYLMKGESREGLSYYEEAINFNDPYLKQPSIMASWVMIETYLMMNKPQKAHQILKNMEKWIEQTDVQNRLLMGYLNVIILADEKESDSISAQIRKMIQLANDYNSTNKIDFNPIYAAQAWDHWGKDDFNESLKLIEKVQESKKWRTALYDLEAKCYLNAGQNKIAIEISEKMSSVKAFSELFPITYRKSFNIKGQV